MHALLKVAVAFLVSVWIVIYRRFFQHVHNYQYEFHLDIRKTWTLLADVLVEFVQSRRDCFVNSEESILQTRRNIDGLYIPLFSRRIKIREETFKGRDGHEIKGEWLIPKNETNSKKAILYFHGGGFCLCSINTHRKLASQVALASKTRLFIFEYRRTPEFVYPAQVHDGIDAFEFLISQNFKPKDIVFVGDSAGGHLAISVPLHILRSSDQQGDDFLPAAVGAMSPWVDLTLTAESFTKNFKTDFLPSRKSMAYHSEIYHGDRDANDWRISPVFGDYTGFPAMYIQASETEQLIDDSTLLASTARKSGVYVKFDTWKNQPHVFQAFGGSAAKDAIDKMGIWVQSQHDMNFYSKAYDSLKSSISIESKYSL